METKIILDNHFVAHFCDVGENQLWLCAHYYDDEIDLNEGPDWGFSSGWHDTLQDAVAYVCNGIEKEYGRDLALEFCDGLGEKLMFDELPRHWTAFAFRH